MKAYRIFSAFLVVCGMLMAGVCSASSPYDWQYRCTPYISSIDAIYVVVGLFGTNSGAATGFDPLDRQLTVPRWSNVATYRAAEEGVWDGPTGFYSVEMRNPVVEVGATEAWDVLVWNSLALPASADELVLHWDGVKEPLGYLVTLTLVKKPSGISAGPPEGTEWVLTARPYAPLRVALPTVRVADGRDGYVFRMTATLVPEPSSLLALSAGLAGMAGALRRRAGAG